MFFNKVGCDALINSYKHTLPLTLPWHSSFVISQKKTVLNSVLASFTIRHGVRKKGIINVNMIFSKGSLVSVGCSLHHVGQLWNWWAIPSRTVTFVFSFVSKPALGLTSFLSSDTKSCCIKLITHFHPVPKLIMYGAVFFFPLCLHALALFKHRQSFTSTLCEDLTVKVKNTEVLFSRWHKEGRWCRIIWRWNWSWRMWTDGHWLCPSCEWHLSPQHQRLSGIKALCPSADSYKRAGNASTQTPHMCSKVYRHQSKYFANIYRQNLYSKMQTVHLKVELNTVRKFIQHWMTHMW